MIFNILAVIFIKIIGITCLTVGVCGLITCVIEYRLDKYFKR